MGKSILQHRTLTFSATRDSRWPLASANTQLLRHAELEELLMIENDHLPGDVL